MSIKIIACLLMLVLSGCTDDKPYTHIDNYQPFENLSISIQKSFDLNRIIGHKNQKLTVAISSTDENLYRIELWTQRYRSRDQKIKVVEINSPQTVVLEMGKNYINGHFTPFYRIECYTNKQMKHKTILYNYYQKKD